LNRKVLIGKPQFLYRKGAFKDLESKEIPIDYEEPAAVIASRRLCKASLRALSACA